MRLYYSSPSYVFTHMNPVRINRTAQYMLIYQMNKVTATEQGKWNYSFCYFEQLQIFTSCFLVRLVRDEWILFTQNGKIISCHFVILSILVELINQTR